MRQVKRFRGSLLALLAAAAVAACGGGGSGGSEAAVAEAPAQTVKLPSDPWLSCPEKFEVDSGTTVDLSCTQVATGLEITSTWVLVSGPAGVQIGPQPGPSAKVLLETDGEFVFELQSQAKQGPTSAGSDGRKSTLSAYTPVPVTNAILTQIRRVVIAVRKVNQPPTVICPAEIELQTNVARTVQCSVTDDGLPLPSRVSFTWSYVSGPGGHTISPQGASVRFTSTKPGAHIVRLVASDSALSTSRDMTLRVVDPINTAPVASCPQSLNGTEGQDLAISCSASDDGLPAGSALSYQWTTLSSPGGANLSGATSANARLVSPLPGSYALRLVASDSQLSSSATVNVVIAPLTNAAPRITCPTSVAGTAQSAVSVGCSVTDDGRPTGSSLRYSWSVVNAVQPVTLLGSNTATASFTPPVAGSYLLRLTASDGQLSSSADVGVSAVAPTPTNVAPKVSCPSGLTGVAGQKVVVTCSASDDGLPVGSSLTYSWRASSSPSPQGTVVSGSGNSASFTPTTAGIYTLEVTASDGVLASQGSVSVNVSAPANQAPVATCPSTLNVVRGQIAVATCTASDDGLPAGASLTPAWTVASAPAAVTLNGAGTYSVQFTPTASGTYRLNFAISDSALSSTKAVSVVVADPPNAAPVVLCPTSVNAVAGTVTSATCTATDDGLPSGSSVSTNWNFVSGPATPSASGVSSNTISFAPSVSGTYVYRYSASDGNLSSSKDVSFVVAAPANVAPSVVCPSQQNGTRGVEVVLTCSASDDGLPQGSTLAPRWSQVSGPATVALSGGSTYSSRFVPSASGTYVFALSVSDGDKSSAASVNVTIVEPPNGAPVVTCPSSLSGVVGQPVNIGCSATDDGLPQGSSLQSIWSVVSGAGGLSWSSQNTATTTVTPAAAGTYQLRLSVSDSATSTAKIVNLSVSNPPNAAPQIVCPTSISGYASSAIPVQCTITDDGMPAGASLSTSWAWVSSAPGDSGFAAGALGATSFTPTLTGTYRLRATASDTNLSSSAEITVTINTPVTHRIQNLGASIVQGYAGQQSFRYRLWQKLIDGGVRFDFVGSRTATYDGIATFPSYVGRPFDRDHEGYAGYTTNQIAGLLPGAMAGYTPDLTVIHAGTNNMLQSGAAGVDPAISGLTAMVSALRAKNPNMKIFVAKLIPVDEAFTGRYGANTYLNMFNDRLPAWAASLTTAASPIYIVDHNTGFNTATETVDGIHPNTLGEEKMAQRWYDAIRSFVN